MQQAGDGRLTTMAIRLDRAFPEGGDSSEFAGQPLAGRQQRQLAEGAGAISLTRRSAAVPAPLTAPHGSAPKPRTIAVPLPGELADDVAEPAFNYLLVKETLGCLAPYTPQLMEHFYALLFARHPWLRSLFPLGMAQQRSRMFAALSRVAASFGEPQSLCAYLGQLARDHRKFGVQESHYRPFTDALLATIRHFAADRWNAETEAAWTAALDYVATVMVRAAAADARSRPAWWVGEVTEHDLRQPDLAVLTIRPDQPYPFLPGQYTTAQVARWPRVWRPYSIANAPREDAQLDLHVRAVPGGTVSNTLVHHIRAGDTVLLGPPSGTMIAPVPPRAHLVCVGGGTGLAPLKAIIQGVIGTGGSAGWQTIRLFLGLRRRSGLYDIRDLRELEAACPVFRVIPVVAGGDPGFDGIPGTLPGVVPRHGPFEDSEIFISGPYGMIRAMVRALGLLAPAAQIHHDPVPEPRPRLKPVTSGS
jgi:NAD(P)H-flavin reductase/hemoglobin-like flavoprotein